MSAASSCMRFLESMGPKYQQLLNVGDAVVLRKRSSREQVEERIMQARLMMREGYSLTESAKAIEMAPSNLRKYLNEEGV